MATSADEFRLKTRKIQTDTYDNTLVLYACLKYECYTNKQQYKLI